MGLLITDSCDSYNATSDLSRVWQNTVGAGWAYAAGAGKNGGGAIQAANPGAAAILNTQANAWGPYGSGVKLTLGFWMKLSGPPASSVQLFNEAASTLATGNGFNSLQVNSSGRIQQNSNNTVGAIGGTNVADNQWHWVEYQNPNITSAPFICYVDNVLQWSGNMAAAQVVSRSYLTFVSLAGVTLTIDDIIYYNDTSPGLVAASFPTGMRRVDLLRPNSDQAVQFTPDSGSTNYSRVNETSMDSDTSYVQSGSSGAADLYGYAALGFTPATINAVQLTSFVKNPAVGSINFKNRCSSLGTTSDGASVLLGPNYNPYRTAYDQDPKTSAAWTASGLGTAQFGVTVV